MKNFIKNLKNSKPNFIRQRLYLHTAIVALFLITMIFVSAWTGNTLTMITAIARFERTHTVSRLEAKTALLEYVDTRNAQALALFYEKMAVTQSYNKVFSDLLTMRTSKTDKEFTQIIENTFKEADHNTAVIIVNRIKVLYWHPIIKELVDYAFGANQAGEKIIALMPLVVAANTKEQQHSVLLEIKKAETDFVFNESSFSKRCSDLSNEITAFVDYVSIAVLILSVGFISLITYLIARSLLQQTVRHANELEETQKQYLNLVEGTPDLITRVDVEGRFIFVNHAAQEFFGLSPEECIGRIAFDCIHPDDREATITAFQNWLKISDKVFMYENRLIGIHGNEHHMEWSIIAEKDENGHIKGFASTARDVTNQKRAEEEKAKLEDQLLQSKKMESVGRLAGGVAHDFNNMLGVIIGHAEMALYHVNPTQPIHEDLTEILKAAERSADLTKQLLAFARRQTIAPKVLDLNDTVAGMLKMVQRLIGEDIHLTWQPAANLWQVNMDPTQIDQILANLCVNARDAITDVGQITIETLNCTFDDDYCANYPDFMPGDYILLAVSDNGRGMDKKTLAQVFEPFFTTKSLGEGTGLGLSTVYGIVRQNNGLINVYSEPGHGTTLKIYLPRYMGKTEQAIAIKPIAPLVGGNETILLVEDEPTFLNLTKTMLKQHGYAVLTANSPNTAMQIAQQNSGEIDLLITDVIMPEMNGRDLAGRLLLHHPHLKYLFMSGYTSDLIAHHGVLDDGVHFIQKPFSIQTLTAKVREVLDN